ncbi:MAG: DUF2334 domain-containing protein [Thermoanaerobaculia bacterium]|nr:DUF2334 domain-containing protein [Thermoanaerobaculia bacterium]
MQNGSRRGWVSGLCALALVAGSAAAPAASSTVTDVVVVYTEPDARTGGLVNARHLEALLGHFSGVSVRLVAAGDYPVGTASAADLVFYIGSPVAAPPAPLLADLSAAPRLCWLGSGAGQLIDGAGVGHGAMLEVRGEGRQPGFDRVEYGDAQVGKGDPYLVEIAVRDGSGVEVRAAVTDGRRRLPYAVRAADLWLFADNPLAYFGHRDRYLVFADLLHEILGRDHARGHQAIVRIADVHPMSDPRQLRDLANVFQVEDVPFLISVVPYYVDPREDVQRRLSDRPGLVEALRYLQVRQGSVVLHGATHRLTGRTLDDLEFWNLEDDRPLAGDSVDLVHHKLSWAVAELLDEGLPPVAWETPGHAASAHHYEAIGRIFTTAIESRLGADRRSAAFSVPYVVERDAFGQRLLPDTLGYVPAESGSVEPLLEAASDLRVIRDGVASVQFHPVVPATALEELIRGLRRLGYTFLDVRSFDNKTLARDSAVVTGAASFTLELGEQTLEETLLDRYGRLTSSTLTEGAGTVTRSVEVPAGSIYVARPYFDEPTAGAAAAVTSQDGLQRLARAGTAIVPLVSRLLERGERQGAAATREAKLLWSVSPSPAQEAEQVGLEIALVAAGLEVERVPIEGGVAPDERHLLVAPGVSVREMPDGWLEAALDAVREGAVLVTTGMSPFAKALGLRAGPPERTWSLEDVLHDRGVVQWTTSSPVATVEVPAGMRVLLRDRETNRAMAVAGRLGRGRVLYLAEAFSESGSGHDRFPDFPHYLRHLGVHPALRSRSLEVFFDPGLRPGVGVGELTSSWRERGVRVVHAAAWHFYESYDYDYAQLIEAAHRRGLLVYAWLEPPQVTADFWLERPECRAKNALGDDARPDWRYPVALTDDRCRRQAFAEYARILDRYDWDGVNIAELGFFGDGELTEPGSLTPFHPSAVRDFEEVHGFSPLSLFDAASPRHHRRDPAALQAFVEFRVDWITDLHRQLLELAEGAAADRPLGFETVVTLLDSLSAPVLRRELGIDAERVLELRSDHEFSLAVEDPASMWSQAPERYEAIAARYLSRGVPERRLLVDINVLGVREAGEHGFPTSQQRGVELQKLGRAATVHTRRALVYAESTLHDEDAEILPAALSSHADLTRVGGGWRVRSAHPVTLVVDPATPEVLVDGEPWPALAEGKVELPAGEHLVQMVPLTLGRKLWGRGYPEPRLTAMSGELLWARYGEHGVDLAYRSLTRTIVAVDRPPLAVLVDDEPLPLPAAGLAPGQPIFLPAGRHEVRLVYERGATTVVADLMHHAGHGLLSLIGLFAAVACSGLALAFAVTLRAETPAGVGR